MLGTLIIGANPEANAESICVCFQNMAMMELRTAVAIVCARFVLIAASDKVCHKDIIASEVMALTLHTKDGIRMHLAPRATMDRPQCQPHSGAGLDS
jgi:hypothetical protein